MTTAHSIEKFDKANQLVGRYMHAFASLELALNRTLTNCLGLGVLQGAIVTSNITFRDKCFIVKTTLDLATTRDSAENKLIAKVINQAMQASSTRNMVAHTFFSPAQSANGMAAVRFHKIQAKGSLDAPDVVWTEETTQGEIDKLHEIAELIEELDAKLSPNAAMLLAKRSKPTVNMLAQALGGLIGHPQTDGPNSDPPTDS